MSEESDRTALALLITACAAYSLHAAFAVVVHRELFGDAAWFLIRILSEGRVTNLYQNFLREFYYSRIFAYGITQLPLLVAARMGLQNINVLSWIFGTTFFIHKPVSLLLCYRVLPKGRKIFMIFPILGLFAGSINSEIYIVSEGHVALSFLWPLLLVLTEAPVPNRTLLMSAAIFMSGLMYESMAFFAPVLLAVTLVRTVKAPPADRPKWLFLSGLLIMVAVFNWLAILFPRDLLNKGSFGMGLLDLIHDTGRGIPHYHIGPTVSVLGILAVMMTLFLGGARSVLRSLIIASVALFLVWAPTAHFQDYWDDLWVAQSVGDRGFNCLLMPLLLTVGFLGIRRFSIAKLKQNATPICILIAALAIGQVAYQVFVTQAWENAVDVVRKDLTTERGPLFCSKSGWDGLTKERILANRMLCEWWVTPLSIFLAPNRSVQALMTPPGHLPFQPIDPLDLKSLPSMKLAPVDYRPYEAFFGKELSKR